MKNKVYRLDELCDIKSGKRIPKEMDFVTFETEHPYIRARDIKAGKINTDDLIYLEDDVFQKIKRYIINSGDIAITIVGASVGDTGYASKNVDGYNLTENAVRLTNYKNNVDSKFLHYVLAQKQYHDYMRLCMELANLLHMYALKITDEHKQKEYMNYTRRWQTHGTIVNILKDAQVYHTISATEFDADPCIFNCKNVTIDMNTLECREHKSSDKLTKISNVIYDPHAHNDR